ncbi:MAG: sigma factor-like helix-turn-helix DNA-binding protein, partial [Clostridia bacterium]
MNWNEFQHKCPIIANATHLFDNRKEAMRVQGEFLRNRKFILDTLLESEAKVIMLRYGLDDGKILTLHQISDILGITSARVSQLELRAIKKLGKMKRVNLMLKYTDETIDNQSIKNATDTNYAGLIRQDIFRTISSDNLKVLKDISIDNWDVKIGHNKSQMLNIKARLTSKGIKTCSDLVEY